MKKEFSCFFTGHRKIPLNDIEQINTVLRKKIVNLIENQGVTDFIAGGALGFDTICARAVLDVKKEYSYINLHLYLPCFDQMKFWTDKERYRARMIMSKSEKIYVTQGNYTNGCMQKRNKKMADDALYCIAYCKNKFSGTSSTIRYATQIGDLVENIADKNTFTQISFEY